MYGKSAEQIALFSVHDEIRAKVTPIDEIQLARYHTHEDEQRITRPMRLSHEFELLLYETVIAIPPSEE